MIPFTLGVVSLLVAQSAVNVPRQAFTTCLKSAVASATAQKLAADAFNAHAMQTCGAQANRFKEALIAFDVGNGIKRGQAATDAQAQIDDVLGMSGERYAEKAEASAPRTAVVVAPAAPAAPAAATVTPAAAPKPQ